MSTTMLSTVDYCLDDSVAWIKLIDIERGNPLNRSSLTALKAALEKAQGDSNCRTIVLSHSGDSFCSGMDFEAVFSPDLKLDTQSLRIFQDCLFLLKNSLQPVICCVRGNVTGGGLGLVAACDLVLASYGSRFMLSEVVVGMVPALITPFLKLRLSRSQIQYLTISSKGVLAADAKSLGLIDEIVAPGELTGVLKAQLQRLMRSSPEAIAASKLYFSTLMAENLQQESEMAMECLLTWFQQPGIAEAIRDFGEGFSPPWFKKYRGDLHV